MRYEWNKTNKKPLYSGCYLPFETAPPASQCTRLNNLSCQPRNCFAICKRHWFCFKTFKMMVCFITWANTGSGTSLYFPWNILHMPAMIALKKKKKAVLGYLPAGIWKMCQWKANGARNAKQTAYSLFSVTVIDDVPWSCTELVSPNFWTGGRTGSEPQFKWQSSPTTLSLQENVTIYYVVRWSKSQSEARKLYCFTVLF